ncbi:uncharacterized protein PV07_10114 [Cladophialophora immunda]|uniref:Zn(2)-C6 fungal-type domain-containing protein n=1 Tax=Cladophialophora immunda TaxID=569365 RepID=A0A0D1Z9M5_9EURO|nr:uncharacterized protein PV07_10114 [Cladophialophora immunda]KIW24396.1 hypothetical protein PV07_10114 [Cladophialophora immunda]
MQIHESESDRQDQNDSSRRGDARRAASPDPQHERPKRRKISQACDQCRARKSRCDGAKPVCHECAVRAHQSTPCRYSSSQNKDRSHDEYISSLLARIQELEGRDGRASRAAAEPTPRSDTNAPAVYEEIMNALSPTYKSSRAGMRADQAAYPTISPIDAMGATSNTKPSEQSYNERFYGSSSAVSFMQQVYKTIETSRAASPSLIDDGPRSRLDADNRSSLSVTLNQLSLLPRPLMDKVLNTYWERVYHLYPFIHQPTFMSAYERLWSSQPGGEELLSSDLLGSKFYGPTSIVFHCAMNLMLALATQFMDLPPEERSQLGQLFSERARSLWELDLFDDGSLAVIQTLLLMTQYLQSTPMPNRCWNCIGITCRLAQGLGLHVETPEGMRKWSPLAVEMRRRVWHGCVMLDAVVSMTLGRPLLLYKFSEIPLPIPVDDEFLGDPATQPRDRVSLIHFYIESIKVYEILADVVSQVYDLSAPARSNTKSDSNVDTILNIEAAISKLEKNLPDHLDWSRHHPPAYNGSGEAVFEQQTSVLRSRLLHLRVLLYRPKFTRYCQYMCAHESARLSDPALDAEFTQVSLAIVRSLSISCVDNSISLIEQLHRFSITSATGAWWYNVFYARTAGAVVLLAMACAAMIDAVGWERMTTAWRKCQEVLSYLQKFSPTVGPCLQGLQKLHGHIMRFRGRASSRRGHASCEPVTHDTTPDNRGDAHIPQGYVVAVPGSDVVASEEGAFMSHEDMESSADSDAAFFEIFNFDLTQPMTTGATDGGIAW